jgi:large subunit ribosomal protein L19
MDILDQISAKQLRDEVPQFAVGDTVKCDVKVVEGARERVQAFQGIVVQKKGSGVSATFTVRKVTQGVAVERVFPLHSPNLAGLKVLRRGKVRRSRIFYLRDLKGKAARIKEKTDRAPR